MKIRKADNLACPLDGLKLETDNKQWICSHGHSFDIARQGYINLLPVQQKRSMHPGDSKEMVAARTCFLDTGVYQSLADAISEQVHSLITGDETLCLLDAGCGEGYYFDYLFQSLKTIEQNTEISFIGLDISKEAILQASKRNKNITWLVGTNRQPPLTVASVDLILCVFGFVSFEGFARILKPGGKVLLVDPGDEHLKELRELIYEQVKHSEPSDIESKQFSIVNSQRCKFKTGNIENVDIKNLLAMTPHLFRASKEGKVAAQEITELDLTVDVIIRTLTKR